LTKSKIYAGDTPYPSFRLKKEVPPFCPKNFFLKMKNQFGLKTVLLRPKSIKLNHIKGFNVLDFKKTNLKINKTQSGYGFDPFVLCSRGGGNFIFFVPHPLNHRSLGTKKT
jgi:hypothetical protein